MPASLRALKGALRKFGGSVEEPRKGSHWKARKDGQCYPIPAHNGLRSEVSDKYISAMCRALGIDEVTLRDLL